MQIPEPAPSIWFRRVDVGPRNILFSTHHGPRSENTALMNPKVLPLPMVCDCIKSIMGYQLIIWANLTFSDKPIPLGACLTGLATLCVYFVSSSSERLRLSSVWMAAQPSKNWAHQPSPAQPSQPVGSCEHQRQGALQNATSLWCSKWVQNSRCFHCQG